MLTAADVPFNGFGIYPDIKDQPVLADGQVRYRGEAVLALVGDARRGAGDPRRGGADRLDARAAASSASTPRPRADAPLVQADKPDNLLLDGGVRRGDAATAFAACAAVAEGVFETAFVEHAYIEPEAG